MESIGNTNVFVTIVLVTHITISNQLSRFQILVLCGMEFSYITFYLFFGNIDKMQDSHFDIPTVFTLCDCGKITVNP